MAVHAMMVCEKKANFQVVTKHHRQNMFIALKTISII